MPLKDSKLAADKLNKLVNYMDKFIVKADPYVRLSAEMTKNSEGTFDVSFAMNLLCHRFPDEVAYILGCCYEMHAAAHGIDMTKEPNETSN